MVENDYFFLYYLLIIFQSHRNNRWNNDTFWWICDGKGWFYRLGVRPRARNLSKCSVRSFETCTFHMGWTGNMMWMQKAYISIWELQERRELEWHWAQQWAFVNMVMDVGPLKLELLTLWVTVSFTRKILYQWVSSLFMYMSALQSINASSPNPEWMAGTISGYWCRLNVIPDCK
jgi:hypothetical protein